MTVVARNGVQGLTFSSFRAKQGGPIGDLVCHSPLRRVCLQPCCSPSSSPPAPRATRRRWRWAATMTTRSARVLRLCGRLARIRGLPQGPRCPAQRRDHPRRPPSARSRRIHAEPSGPAMTVPLVCGLSISCRRYTSATQAVKSQSHLSPDLIGYQYPFHRIAFLL